GAEVADDVIWIYDVAPGFAHLAIVLTQNHALVDEAHEWLGRRKMAEVEEDLVPKAGIEQVQDRMLSAPKIEVNGHPMFFGFLADEDIGVFRIEVTKIIPAGAGPLGHGVGLAPGRSAALGAS